MNWWTNRQKKLQAKVERYHELDRTGLFPKNISQMKKPCLIILQLGGVEVDWSWGIQRLDHENRHAEEIRQRYTYITAKKNNRTSIIEERRNEKKNRLISAPLNGRRVPAMGFLIWGGGRSEHTKFIRTMITFKYLPCMRSATGKKPNYSPPTSDILIISC